MKMGSEDEFESLSVFSSSPPQRSLKRLKRAFNSPIKPSSDSDDDDFELPAFQSLEIVKSLNIDNEEGEDRVLESKDSENGGDGDGDGDEDSKLERKRKNVDEDVKVKKKAVNKRKQDKREKKKKGKSESSKLELLEMRVVRQQLHAETQRVLRESRDVGFRASPVVHKPISSVLEKIRARKLQLSNRTAALNNTFDEPATSKPVDNGSDIEADIGVSPTRLSGETTTDTTHEQAIGEKELDVEPTPAFRAPVNDTEDIFDDSQVKSSVDQVLDDEDSPVEEPFAPSLLAMNLKFDSALPDDSSSDGEDNEKENIGPDLQEAYDDCTSPKGDPVKAFIDEEAEEDDSDNDINCLRDDEEDEDEDAEELNDMIARDYKERHTDKERRDELHQKWLEQQDAAGTDHLLQRFNYKSKHRETTIGDEDQTDNEVEEEFSNEVQDDLPRDNARMNLKRAKQMIAQMFLEKDDVFLSDEEEETGKMIEKQRLLRSEERAKLISPAEDENSREVFGLIKKLNVVPENKRKPKQASILDTMLGERSDCSLKSSFIGRTSDHHLASSKGKRSSVTRSFVFGRDDSNSRSSVLTADDSLDAAVSEGIKSSKNTTAKFTSSQARPSQSSSSSAGGKAAETPLLDILLKKSLTPSSVKSTGISMSSLSGSVLEAFKIPRRPVRAEGRGL